MADDDAALDELLERIEALDERGDAAGVRRLVTEGRTLFPTAVELREWQATIALDDERYTDALVLLDGILAELPDDFSVRRERASVLLDMGRVPEALADLERLPAAERKQLPRLEQAAIAFDVGLCLDCLGRQDAADAAYGDAARLAPRRYAVPQRRTREAFEALVSAALDDIPDAFDPYLRQVVVTVQHWPGLDVDDPFQLGLYVGVPRNVRSAGSADHLDTVVVYQRPHEIECEDDAELQAEVRRTVIHELAHHFGIEHEAMGEYE